MRENILIVEREVGRLQKDDIINEKDYESGDKLDIIEMTDDLVRYFCTYDGYMAEKLLIKTMEEVGEEIKQRKGDVMLKFSEIIQNHARQKGLQEGRQEGEQSIILKMLKNNMDISTIAKITEVTEDKILQLQKKLNNLG